MAEEKILDAEAVKDPEMFIAVMNKQFQKYNGILADTATKGEVKQAFADLVIENKDILSKVTTSDEKMDALKKQLEKFTDVVKIQGESITTLKTAFDPKTQRKSFREAVLEQLQKGVLTQIFEKKSNQAVFQIEMKDIAFTGTYGAGAATQAVMPFQTPVFTPEEDFDIRTVVPTGNADNDKLDYPQEYSITDNTGALAENAAGTESEIEFTMAQVTGKRIHSWIKVSRSALKNVNWLANHISTRLLGKFVKYLNTQSLTGTGLTVYLSGLVTNATTFTAGSLAGTFENANELDVFIAARARNYQVNHVKPNVIFLNPLDAARLYSLKSTTKDWVNREPYMTVDPNGLVRVSGMPIIESFDITAGTYLMANNSRQYMELLFNGPVEIRSTDSADDDFQKNLVSISLEAEVLLPIYNTGALITGTLADDLKAISTI